jgi:hypothetical protein
LALVPHSKFVGYAEKLVCEPDFWIMAIPSGKNCSHPLEKKF